VYHGPLVPYSCAWRVSQAAVEDLEDRRVDLQRTERVGLRRTARTSTSWYLFDEAALIPDKVWTVAEGGLTDGQMFFLGSVRANAGRFYEINFGSKEHRWNHRTIDSRQSRFTNKALIAQAGRMVPVTVPKINNQLLRFIVERRHPDYRERWRSQVWSTSTC
jgi:hypothetical protein